MHLNDLSAKVKEGVQKAGLVGYRFNTIGVSDGISMGTSGMSYSLQSRDIIADSIETVSAREEQKTRGLCCYRLNREDVCVCEKNGNGLFKVLVLFDRK